MKRFLKKIFNKFTLSLTIALVCVCSLFAMTKSYAYELDNNGYLVGNNTLNNQYTTNNVIADLNNTLSYSIINNNPTYTLTLNNTNLGTNAITFNVKTRYYDVTQTNFLNIGVLVEFDNTMISTISTQIGISAGLMNGDNFINSYYTKFSSINPSTSGKSVLLFTNYYKSYYTSNNIYLGIGIYFNTNLQNLTNINGTMKVTFFIFEQNSNIKANAINSNQTMVPYSSIEQLQQDYNTLLGQYNELRIVYQQYQDTHSHSNTQYNDLVSQINTLQGQLSQLQLQYDTYVATHSYTDAQYNELNTQYQILTNN